MPTPRKLSTEREEELACRLDNGEKATRLAKEDGVTLSYVSLLKRNRLKWGEHEGKTVVCPTEWGDCLFEIRQGQRYFVSAAS